jgi:hypothetical protein
MDDKLRRVSNYLTNCKTSADFNPMAIANVLQHVFVLGIERDGATNKLRLRIKLMGGALDAAFGRSLVGQYLESFIHGPRGGDVIKGFHDCANTREPLWMRQIMEIEGKGPRFVEGVLFYLEPQRIYGALLVGTLNYEAGSGFERRSLRADADNQVEAAIVS